MVEIAHDHDTILAGAHGGAGPAIVARTDEDFIAALLAELERDGIAAVVGGEPAGVRTLLQPVHRVFNIALVEAHCDVFGEPRLDPAKIESAGIVVRRVAEEEKAPRGKAGGRTAGPRGRPVQYEAWLSDSHRVRGWVPLAPGEADADPDPARRRLARFTGERETDRRLAGDRLETSEQAATLFVAPPAVIAATGRTLLFNVLPVASTSRAGTPKPERRPSLDEWAEHLPALVRAHDAFKIGFAGPTLTADAANLDLLKNGALLFAHGVRQLAQEFSLLRPVDAAKTKAFLDELDGVAVALADGTTRPAGAYVAAAAAVMFDVPAAPADLPAPVEWPAISAQRAGALARTLRALSDAIQAKVIAGPGSLGRFDEPGRQYVARAFVRVRHKPGCPPKLVWSGCSARFTIAPWYAPSPVPPIQVALPDPMDPDFKASAAPGVAFNVPESLAKFLNQDPKKILAGTAGPGTTPGLGFLCGFSIPIITICAFILLNIMLNLLNLIFRWLPFVKICIPFPKVK